MQSSRTRRGVWVYSGKSGAATRKWRPRGYHSKAGRYQNRRGRGYETTFWRAWGI